MTGDEIREAYLKFFEKKGHTIVPSSSLIPHGDPTLLLTTAGMVQFKRYFLGEETPPNRRLASCQKSFRTTDIESVGDFNHLTFFEMLGNFSIGDYFKEESIGWAWDFVTRVLKLPKERLWITVFLDDDEAAGIWRKLGVPEDRIVRFDEKDNFWGPAGSSGPCGPCSEIHYDFGEKVGCRQPTCTLGCRCGRFSEIWNLVFTQFNQDTEGKRTPLPRPNIDTGMGLERITTVMQGKLSVYETDLFAPLVERVGAIAGMRYGSDATADNTMRIIAEHGRAVAFLIADGVMPANEGRGYVLRRLLRRASYFGETLSPTKPFLTEVAEMTIEKMGHVYPELAKNRDFILKVIESEIERFREALNTGSELLNRTFIAMRKELVEYIPKLKKDLDEAILRGDIRSLQYDVPKAIDQFQIYCPAWNHTLIIGGRNIIDETLRPIQDRLDQIKQASVNYEGSPRHSYQELREYIKNTLEDILKSVHSISGILYGHEIFALHDTYGFPAELTRELALKSGYGVDLEGFEREMAAQRERARAASRFDTAPITTVESVRTKATEFTGYDTLESKPRILEILVGGKPVDTVHERETASIILETTPFYAEMGGQVGDQGRIAGDNGEFLVTATSYGTNAVVIHEGQITRGTLAKGDSVLASVDRERRLDIARNHTATHLLHNALRKVLGEHAEQKGSLVAPDRLRFDFSHLNSVSEEELQNIQRLVNESIRKNLGVSCQLMPIKQALQEGAIALFDEKYGETVRVVRIGEPALSRELCGGTHVTATGELGLFRIISESSIGAGLRRIEAVTGRGAEAYTEERLSRLEKVAGLVGGSVSDVESRVAALVGELASERRQREALERELSLKAAETLLSQVEAVSGVSVLTASLPPTRPELLREMSDFLKDKLKSAVIVLATVQEGRPLFLAVVTPDLVAKGLNAGNIVREVARVTGGGGGGRANLAQAGGKDKSKIAEALALVKSLIARGTGNA
ncbi:MAG: alanine--tRNA ligase [Chloroflexota bacterium]